MSTLAQEINHEMQITAPPLLTESSAALQVSVPESTQNNAQATPKGDSKLYSRRLLIHTTASAQELAAGKVLTIPDAEAIFKPDFATTTEADLNQLQNCDLSRGIVSKVEVMSCFSSCDAPVVMGLRLFNRNDSSKSASYEDLKISNENGWLYSCAKNNLGETASKGRSGVTNVFSLQPFERMRQADGVSVYTPSNIISNRYIAQYGSYNWRNLWEGIVQFPDEKFYYVSKDHVILKVIVSTHLIYTAFVHPLLTLIFIIIQEQNWELLGMDVRSEIPREGRYVKVATNVADRVIKELYDNV